MSTSTFIEQLAAGQASDAKETLSNLLSARAFEALDTRKQELASTLFGGQVEEEVEELEEMDYGNDEEKSPSKGHGHSGVKVKPGKEITVKPMSVKSATSSAFNQLNKAFDKNSENKTNAK